MYLRLIPPSPVFDLLFSFMLLLLLLVVSFCHCLIFLLSIWLCVNSSAEYMALCKLFS